LLGRYWNIKRRSLYKILLSQQIGFSDADKGKVEDYFGISALIPEIIKKNEPFVIPSEQFSGLDARKFLSEAKVKSALIVPLFSGDECLGILFLGSDLTISGENTKEYVRVLGMQLGQSIALASAFQSLETSEKRYRQLVEISPDPIFIEQDDKFVYANSAALKLLNAYNLNQLLSSSFYDFFPLDYKTNIKEYIDKAKNNITTSLIEGKVINLKNTVLDVEIVISPFIYQAKPALYMIMRDITERKRSALHLEIQYAIAWILAESATLYVATNKILKIICTRLHWDCGTIWAVDTDANVLRCTRVWQMPELHNVAFQLESLSRSYELGIGLPGQIWKERKAVWKSDILHEVDFLRKDSAAELGLNTAVAFPIIYENEVLGVIEFLSRKTLESDQDLLLWFESIGNQFGLFLKRKHMERQMLYLAEHDILTGLSNRTLLEQYLNTAIQTAIENNQKLAVIFLDLDHFKNINDSLGHEAGDFLLKEISERFTECLRPQDRISRLGGDEFVIIIPNIQSKEQVVEIITRLQNQLAEKISLKDKDFFITVSIGVSLYPEDGSTVQTLIKAADIAMYTVKEKGRNNFQFCTPEMTVLAENRAVLENNLRKALENDEFILYYQPKIDLATKKVSGMEALIRWKRPEGILLPSTFIAAAETSDLIIPIGEWVLKKAFMQNKIWQTEGLAPITMSVNLSVRNLNNNLLQLMEKTLEETQLDPNTFEIELTESVLMDNVENNIEILRSLKAMGVQISIDDFGTGYSSLSYLKRFPIDTLKIDQAFVRDIATDPDDAAIVTAIIAMAHSLGFKVIAEGVETQEQLKFLCEHGCDEIQGFYFGRPLPVDEATHFMKNAKITWTFEC
jgi:diguanylate cyclase (GGDEF)-like protein/PAS domain S-box-containing protein